jgi:hypothetical protein
MKDAASRYVALVSFIGKELLERGCGSRGLEAGPEVTIAGGVSSGGLYFHL